MAIWKGAIDTISDIKALDSNNVPTYTCIYCNELEAWVAFYDGFLSSNSNDGTAFDANDGLGFWANVNIQENTYTIFIPGSVSNQEYTILPEILNDCTFLSAVVYSGAATSYDIDIEEDGNPTVITSDTGVGSGKASLSDSIPYEDVISSGGRLYADITNAVGVTDLTIQVTLREFGIFKGN